MAKKAQSELTVQANMLGLALCVLLALLGLAQGLTLVLAKLLGGLFVWPLLRLLLQGGAFGGGAFGGAAGSALGRA